MCVCVCVYVCVCEETLTGEVGSIVSAVDDDIIPDQWRNTRDGGLRGASAQHVRAGGGGGASNREHAQKTTIQLPYLSCE